MLTEAPGRKDFWGLTVSDHHSKENEAEFMALEHVVKAPYVLVGQDAENSDQKHRRIITIKGLPSV